MSTMTTVELKPVGLQTPEGEARVTRTLKAFENSHAEVANATSQFIHRYIDEIKAVIVRANDDDMLADFKDVLDIIKRREAAQEDFLRALAGAPEVTRTDDDGPEEDNAPDDEFSGDRDLAIGERDTEVGEARPARIVLRGKR